MPEGCPDLAGAEASEVALDRVWTQWLGVIETKPDEAEVGVQALGDTIRSVARRAFRFRVGDRSE
jgi:hypothetical protein